MNINSTPLVRKAGHPLFVALRGVVGRAAFGCARSHAFEEEEDNIAEESHEAASGDGTGAGGGSTGAGAESEPEEDEDEDEEEDDGSGAGTGAGEVATGCGAEAAPYSQTRISTPGKRTPTPKRLSSEA